MATLTYFTSECLHDSTIYSYREPRKKDIKAQLINDGYVEQEDGTWKTSWGGHSGKITRQTIFYKNAFDLADKFARGMAEDF